jgi:hypothetical protein
MDGSAKELSVADKILEMKLEIKKIIDLPDEAIKRLANGLINYEPREFRKPNEREKLSDELGIPHFILNESIPALIAAFATAMRSKTDLGDYLSDFLEGIAKDDEIMKIKKFSSDIQPFLKACYEDIKSFNAARIPIDELMGMAWSIINIAQFKEDPEIEDKLDQYESIIKRYHPRVLISFAMGEQRKPITCVVGEKEIENMIKSLGFIKKQLETINKDNIKE